MVRPKSDLDLGAKNVSTLGPRIWVKNRSNQGHTKEKPKPKIGQIWGVSVTHDPNLTYFDFRSEKAKFGLVGSISSSGLQKLAFTRFKLKKAIKTNNWLLKWGGIKLALLVEFGSNQGQTFNW